MNFLTYSQFLNESYIPNMPYGDISSEYGIHSSDEKGYDKWAKKKFGARPKIQELDFEWSDAESKYDISILSWDSGAPDEQWGSGGYTICAWDISKQERGTWLIGIVSDEDPSSLPWFWKISK